MLQELFLSHSGEIGLVLFALVFATTSFWAITRTRHQVDHWSNLPLGEGESSQNREME